MVKVNAKMVVISPKFMYSAYIHKVGFMSHVPSESALLHPADPLSCSVVHPPGPVPGLVRPWEEPVLAAAGARLGSVPWETFIVRFAPCFPPGLMHQPTCVNMRQSTEQQNTKKSVNGVLSVARPHISW